MLPHMFRIGRRHQQPSWSPVQLFRPGRSTFLHSSRSFGSAKHAVPSRVSIEPRVRHALEKGQAVVALESTIISHGMPYPENLAMARGVEDIIRARGAVPATVAILKGRPHVGLTSEQLESLAEAGPRARKCSRRDLAVAMAQGVDGATTVASTAYLASLVGVKVFVTGGMGGVHRGAETTFDVSADLAELAQTPIVVVCAGVKSILDIEKTLEVLETNGVPVISYDTDDFPAFFSPTSGVQSPLRLDNPSEVAAAAKAGFDLGMRNGMILAVPNPSPMAGGAGVDAAIRVALEEANARGLKGRDVTPFVLAAVNDSTGGQSLKSNVALVRHNAEIGAEIAVELAGLTGPPASRSSLAAPEEARHASRAALTPEETPSPLPFARSESRPSLSPKVVVFGGAVSDVVSKPYSGTPLTPGTSSPGETRQSFGGVGRNVAEGLARVLAGRGSAQAKDKDDNSNRSVTPPEIALISAVGADDAGRALVVACEEAGVSARATVQVGAGASREGHNGEEDLASARTASYVAMLDDDGELVAAVADMRVLERMTADFVEKHAGVLDGADVVIADGNIPPEGLAQLARLCTDKDVPLVFEPTSVVKSSAPFTAKAMGGIALTTPNLDELAAMASAATAKNKNGQDSGSQSSGNADSDGSMRAGHALAQAAIVDGEFVDPRPLGAALKTVLAAMLDVEGLGVASRGEGVSTARSHAAIALLDGAKHIAVTMGSAGVLLASARPIDGKPHPVANEAILEAPLSSGLCYSLSAEHYGAIPPGCSEEGAVADCTGAVADCTGAGDCFVAGIVGGFSLGWSTRDSTCLGMLCAKQSVVADTAVPKSLSDLLSRTGDSKGHNSRPSLRAMGLPHNYEAKEVYPWRT